MVAGAYARKEMHWSQPGGRRGVGRWHPHGHLLAETRRYWPSQSSQTPQGTTCRPGRLCPACGDRRRTWRAVSRSEHAAAAAGARTRLDQLAGGCGRDWSVQGVWRDVCAALVKSEGHPAWTKAPTIVDVRAVRAGITTEITKYVTKGAKVSSTRLARLIDAVGSGNAGSWWAGWHGGSADCLVPADAAPAELVQRSVALPVQVVVAVADGALLGPGWPDWARELASPDWARAALARLFSRPPPPPPCPRREAPVNGRLGHGTTNERRPCE